MALPSPTQPTANGGDGFAPASARFPLAAAYSDLPFSDAVASGDQTRPFVLRVAGRPAPKLTGRLPPARYCQVRQIAVTDDAVAAPIYPEAATRTTVGSKDGKDNPQEDWKPDV